MLPTIARIVTSKFISSMLRGFNNVVSGHLQLVEHGGIVLTEVFPQLTSEYPPVTNVVS